jgi:hypothetical protein
MASRTGSRAFGQSSRTQAFVVTALVDCDAVAPKTTATVLVTVEHSR